MSALQTLKDQRSATNLRLQPGEFHVTLDKSITIVTILGSCVAACIRNPRSGFGGMNHFMLPQSDEGQWGGVSAQMRYGNHAMETLINEVLKSGCQRHELEVKLFGGANMYSGSNQVGSKNSAFALAYIRNEGLGLCASDLGGTSGRRIHYTPSTGKVRRLLLNSVQDTRVNTSEHSYQGRLTTKPIEGDIELFQ
jgi:chemotaxis protein CheD